MAKRSRKTKKFEDMSEEEVTNLAQPNVTTDELGRAHEDRLDRKDNNNLEETPAEKEVLDQEEQRGVEEGGITDRINPEELPEPEAVVEEGEEKAVTSVVADKYKKVYIANAAANGLKGKAAKRSNWDWLSQKLADYCLGEKEKIDIQRFKDVLGANGIDYSKWTNQSKGWEGRFRMTGRVVLQKVVANSGILHMPGEERIDAPADFVAKYKTKT